MEFKKLLTVLTVAITITVGAVFGISYAWYAFTDAEVDVSGTSKSETPTVIFSNTEYIASDAIMPIYDEDRYNYAIKNTFTVTLDDNLMPYEVGIQIALTDITISNELKIENYKYELTSDGKTVSEGNFSNLTGQTMNLLPMTVLSPETYPHTYTYELYTWLKEDETDQNELMNKTFKAKIDVKSAIKKK